MSYRIGLPYYENTFEGTKTLIGTKRKANRLIRSMYSSFWGKRAVIRDERGWDVSIRYGDGRWKDE